MKVGRFVPPAIRPQPIDEEGLERRTGQHWRYASSGKAAIYHCLRAAKVTGPVALPIYACTSILAPIKALGLEPVFIDIDPDDLNLSFESFVAFASKRPVGALIVPSLYGNPAALDRCETYCREHGIIMIDDAAQSFGAMLDGRFVGTFGDAGLFSFSPGKATAGHGGGFFWTRPAYDFERDAHPLAHRIKWWNFYLSRLHAYDMERFRKLLTPLSALAGRLDRQQLWMDRMELFEAPILGGILADLFNDRYAFRKEWTSRFEALVATAPILRLVRANRGNAHPHKLVLVAAESRHARALMDFFAVHNLFSAAGYHPLSDGNFPGWRSIEGRVIELAIDENPSRMQCQYELLQQFLQKAMS